MVPLYFPVTPLPFVAVLLPGVKNVADQICAAPLVALSSSIAAQAATCALALPRA